MIKKIPSSKRRWILRRADRSVVRDISGKVIVFMSKYNAKTYRDQISKDLVVSPGPDHRKW